MRRIIDSIKLNAWVFPLMLATTAYARSQLDPKSEMIKSADVIAIVEIDKVDATQTHAALALYQQQAHANVERVVDGALPGKDLLLFGNEQQLVEARTHLSAGRFLAFLKQDTLREGPAGAINERSARVWEKIYVGANGNPSLRPIHGDRVEWYADDHYAKKISAPLQTVLDEVQKIRLAATSNASDGSPAVEK